MARPTLYWEASVISYLAAHPSRDVIVSARQQITRQWWVSRERFDLYASPVVLEESALGDPAVARERSLYVDGLPVLAASEQIEQVAATCFRELRFPEKALRDAARVVDRVESAGTSASGVPRAVP